MEIAPASSRLRYGGRSGHLLVGSSSVHLPHATAAVHLHRPSPRSLRRRGSVSDVIWAMGLCLAGDLMMWQWLL
jgi:hypothetical protein